MKVIPATAELEMGGRPACLAIGVFDGVHMGHQQVILRAVDDARRRGGVPVVVTFDRHPNAVVAPDRVPPLIYPLAKKLRVLESLGAEAVCVIHFDKAFSEISGEEFIRGLARDCRRIESISVGGTFAFGCRRSGDVALIQKLGKELNFAVYALAEVSLDGQPVSSTRVREAVRAGQFEQAGRMLGRAYTLCGQVIKGKGMGRTIGVPTANLESGGLLTPPLGVYAARALVRGKPYRAAVNIGRRPTVDKDGTAIHVEAHLLDFAADIYGEEMELEFLAQLREEQKFPSLAALQAQLAQDIARARAA